VSWETFRINSQPLGVIYWNSLAIDYSLVLWLCLVRIFSNVSITCWAIGSAPNSVR